MSDSELKELLLTARKKCESKAKEVIKGLNEFNSTDKHSGKDLKRFHDLSKQAVELMADLNLIDNELKELE